MYESAMSRIGDADTLSSSLRLSDSASILRILGMEILLKAAIALAGLEPKKSHNYLSLWNQLPVHVRDRVVEVANRRMPTHADLSNIPKLLTWYQYIFEKIRYPYEQFENYTDEEIRELSRFWGDDLDAAVDEALVQYYPNELTCLIEGLKVFVEAQLSNQSLERTGE
jgi:hypothetical protein